MTVKLSENALRVLNVRYLIKDSQGCVVETPEEMFYRVADHIAKADSLYGPDANIETSVEEFYQVMTNLEFLPNSPTLMNAGRRLGQLSACFVLPIDDSIESIFEAVKNTALIHQSGGGTGFSFSRLRPEGDLVGSTGGIASGPVSFMRAFDVATEVIKQGGKRRGANIAVLRVDHPDIQKFIVAKENSDLLTNFNISVAVTESFMVAVDWGVEYELVNPRTQDIVGSLNAREVFAQIIDMAWRNGDPGIIFIDEINKHNPTKYLGKIESTNPCGEQPLLPYESCNLGSINLARMVFDDDIDWPKLEKTVKTAVRFLDNVIDVNKFPLTQIEEMTKKTRKIGLGVMGFADMLIKLGIPYDSERACQTAESLMGFIATKANEASTVLAEERGVFPSLESAADFRGPLIRNATRTTIAPTGSLSLIANCSSGIEPLFALSYTRYVLDGEQLIEVNSLFEETAVRDGFYSKELMREVATKGTLKSIEGIPEEVKKLFITAHDITPEQHIEMQSSFQRNTDNAVSKTVNLPYDATREDVAKVYKLAYEKKLKGVTIYRDQSRELQVLNITRASKGAYSDAISRVLEKYPMNQEQKQNWTKQCPDCGGVLAHQNSCYICFNCGYTKCS